MPKGADIADIGAASYYSATAEELIKAGESMTNLTELASGGYAASLGVYHELHCLVRT